MKNNKTHNKQQIKNKIGIKKVIKKQL